MFRIEELRELSCRKLELQLQKHWISDTFMDCVQEVYSTSQDKAAIRTIVMSVAATHIQELIQKQYFQELIREIGDFAVDLMVKMASIRRS
jgi:hypothetical protein